MSILMNTLLDLNRVDRKIVRGKLRLQEVMRAVTAQEKKVEEVRDSAKGYQEAIKGKAFGADQLNMEIRTAEAEVADQERKLKTIKNQKEFRIISDRIKDLKIQVDENESAVLSSMEELDKLREQINDAHTRIGEEELKLTTTKQTAQEDINEIKATHAVLLEQRKQAVQQCEAIDASVYQAYDMALKRTKGDPIAEMTMDGICQSCFRRQNSNVMNIVHIGEDVKSCRCQGCGRILYVKSNGEEEQN